MLAPPLLSFVLVEARPVLQHEGQILSHFPPSSFGLRLVPACFVDDVFSTARTLALWLGYKLPAFRLGSLQCNASLSVRGYCLARGSSRLAFRIVQFMDLGFLFPSHISLKESCGDI